MTDKQVIAYKEGQIHFEILWMDHKPIRSWQGMDRKITKPILLNVIGRRCWVRITYPINKMSLYIYTFMHLNI